VRIKSSLDRRDPHETFRRCDYGGGGGEGRCVRNAFVPPFSPPSTPFFPPAPFLVPAEELVCFRGGVLRDNVPFLFDSITLRALPFTCDVSAGQVPKVLQSLAIPRRWRTCEYPIFMASHFLLSSPPRLYLIFYGSLPFAPLSIFLQCLSLRELFNRLFPILRLYFLFFFPFFFGISLHAKVKRHATKANNCVQYCC